MHSVMCIMYNIFKMCNSFMPLFQSLIELFSFFSSRFGVKRKPLYINLVRDPLDRLVSFYYFTRNGDDIRPPRERRKDRTKEVCVIVFLLYRGVEI